MTNNARLVKKLVKLIVLQTLITGCTSNQHVSPPSFVENPAPLKQHIQQAVPATQIPVIRYSRYTLVEVGTTTAQRDIFAQIVDITIPSLKEKTTVADAMQYLLIGSGYKLCESEKVSAFHSFLLPFVHSHLGPITLKDALKTLAGKNWKIEFDHQKRTVCFHAQTRLITQGL